MTAPAYFVPCPLCRTEAGRSCRADERVLAVPHVERTRAAERQARSR